MIYNYGNKNRYFFALIASCVWKETLILRTSNRNSLLKHLFISEKYMAKQFFIFLFCFFYGAVRTLSAQNLEQSIRAYLVGKQAEVGVAVIFNGTDTLTVNNDNRYPLMSVVKFHQALAVADTLTALSESVDHEVLVTPEDLKPNTYSPLRDRFPKGNIRLSVHELLKYTLQLSDNNACDILFNRITDIPTTVDYLQSIGCTDFAIMHNEEEMHQNLEHCYGNWSTPLETARLFEKLFTENLFTTHLQDTLKNILWNCSTGTNRLPAPLPSKVRIAHKTGTGDRNKRGEIIGLNDAGFVLLPDGQHYSLAVFVKNSKESDQDTERIIATISERVYQYISNQHQKNKSYVTKQHN